ncbi:hypothetical protein sos41_06060 [Alphaproteobacteria bacterium SO-S41]|nr:hypothetical protein sos41_06060 [Alphaproteobacteria bacterium SO-S41]
MIPTRLLRVAFAVLAGLTVPALAMPTADGTATLTVTIRGVLPQPSQLLLGVFTAAEYEEKISPIHQSAEAMAPETVVTFEALTPGRVAVKVLQDLNGNWKMDKTLIGVPEEPFGLSNDARPSMGLPGFDETGFDLHPGPNTIVITLQEM